MENKYFRILAVDDEKLILDLIKETLDSSVRLSKGSEAEHHYNLSVFEQGPEAVEAVHLSAEEKRPFSLAFIDINMPPGPDGVWTAKRIRELDSDIYIVMVTGYSGIDLLEMTKHIPPPDKLLYVEKPFHPQEIWQFANSLSSRWQVERELQAIRSGLEDMVKERTSALMRANEQLKAEIETRSRAEDALKVSETSFRNVITRQADAIVILSRAGNVLYMNPVAEIMFGRKTEEFKGQSFWFPVLAGETIQLDVVSPKGAHIISEMRVVETEWEGESALIASLRDVTALMRMQQEIQDNVASLERAVKGTIQAIAGMVEKRDQYTAGHQERVARLAVAIGTHMGLPKDRVEGIHMAGVIHDLGKTAVPVEILSKPSRLSDDELTLIKIHPEVGHDTLKDIEFPWPIAKIILQHHERMDGSGYPYCLSGDEMLLEARILAVADVVEAMASHRPYRASLGVEVALEEISQNRGVLYDPEVVDICLMLFREKRFDLETGNTRPLESSKS